MTEQEWLDCPRPEWMLDFLGKKISLRKLRLFACACCRLAWHLLVDERSRKALEVLEQCADGLAPNAALMTAALGAEEAVQFTSWAANASGAAHCAAIAVRSAVDESWVKMTNNVTNALAADREPRYGRAYTDMQQATRRTQAALLRDAIGNPFRTGPGAGRPAVGALIKVAAAICAERCFEELPILADALEEAGYAEAEVLDHLRGPGPHARGCWALDTLLGKS